MHFLPPMFTTYYIYILIGCLRLVIRYWFDALTSKCGHLNLERGIVKSHVFLGVDFVVVSLVKVMKLFLNFWARSRAHFLYLGG